MLTYTTLSDEDYFCHDPYVFCHMAKTCPLCYATEEKKPVVETGVSLM